MVIKCLLNDLKDYLSGVIFDVAGCCFCNVCSLITCFCVVCCVAGCCFCNVCSLITCFCVVCCVTGCCFCIMCSLIMFLCCVTGCCFCIMCSLTVTALVYRKTEFGKFMKPEARSPRQFHQVIIHRGST